MLPLFLSVCACEQRPAWPSPPNVLIVLVDALRADRLGSYGSTKGLTPFLDELAASGIVFRNAYAASSWTRPSVASLFTSRYPSQHGATGIVRRLSDEELTLPEILRPLGYSTGVISGSQMIGPVGGFEQGVQYFRQPESRDKVPLKRLANETFQWLDEVWDPTAPRPTFLYLHAMEPHGPYLPPEPYRSRYQHSSDSGLNPYRVNYKLIRLFADFMGRGRVTSFRQFTPAEVELLKSLYDGEVAALDVQLREFFAGLRRRGFLDNAIVVVTADHGEEFAEHGSAWHGYTLYDESIRVPLIMLVPGYGGRTVDENASLVDVLPTLLDLLGAPASATFEGRSLAQTITDSWWAPRRLYARWAGGEGRRELWAELEHIVGLRVTPRHSRMLIRQSTKLLTQPDGSTEIYDLARDPYELRSNSASLSSAATDMLTRLRRREDDLASRANARVEAFELDDVAKSRLRALGYLMDQDGEAPGSAPPR